MSTTEEYIRPFSNGSEFMLWQSNNCDRCRKYENKSTSREEAKCKLAFDLDISTMTGTISRKTAENIGFFKGYIADRCKRFTDENQPVKHRKRSKAKKDNLTLF